MSRMRSTLMPFSVALVAIALGATVSPGHFPRTLPTPPPSVPPPVSRPTITVIEDGESVYRDVVINVKETQTGSLMFGAGVNADAGLVGSQTSTVFTVRPSIGFWSPLLPDDEDDNPYRDVIINVRETQTSLNAPEPQRGNTASDAGESIPRVWLGGGERSLLDAPRRIDCGYLIPQDNMLAR